MVEAQRLAALRPIRQLIVGASLLDRIPPGTAPAPQRAGGTETRTGLALLRDLAVNGQIVHDETTYDLDMALAAAQVREAPTGLFLIARGPTHLVRALVWAVGAAHKPAPRPGDPLKSDFSIRSLRYARGSCDCLRARSGRHRTTSRRTRTTPRRCRPATVGPTSSALLATRTALSSISRRTDRTVARRRRSSRRRGLAGLRSGGRRTGTAACGRRSADTAWMCLDLNTSACSRRCRPIS